MTGLQSFAGFQQQSGLPLLALCDHQFPPGLERGGQGWNLAHLSLTQRNYARHDEAMSDQSKVAQITFPWEQMEGQGRNFVRRIDKNS